MTDVFNAKNQHTSHDMALTSDAMTTKIRTYSHGLPSQNTPSWHTSTTSQGTPKLPHQVKLYTLSRRLRKKRQVQTSLNIVDIAAPAVMSYAEAAPDHNKETGTATLEANSR